MKSINFKGQDYHHLKVKCTSRNLFVDPVFKADRQSLFFSHSKFQKDMDSLQIEWLRPNKICQIMNVPRPKFHINGFSSLDVRQGTIGNCWFIAGINSVIQHTKMFSQVVPSDQTFESDYAGIFHFRFWQYGNWYDVVVDDLLPFSKLKRKLVFAHNPREPNEFWVALLEKAYAKLYSTYESLVGGHMFSAIIDMTGGIVENRNGLNLVAPHQYDQYWSAFFQMFNKKSMMGCVLPINHAARGGELITEKNLVHGHAFTITKYATVNFRGQEKRLVRIKNPWGNEIEWNGAWSDKSVEWTYVSDKDKKEIGFIVNNDGEFWMSFEDFMKTWGRVEICHLSCDCLIDEISKFRMNDITWNSLSENVWKSATLNFEYEKHKPMPAIFIEIEANSNSSPDGFKTLIIAMTQKGQHLIDQVRKPSYMVENIFLFKLYQIPYSVNINMIEANLNGIKTSDLNQVGISECQTMKDTTGQFKVAPGNYLLLPFIGQSNSSLNDRTEFMIRIFADDKANASLMFPANSNYQNTVFDQSSDVKNFSLSEISKLTKQFSEIQLSSCLQGINSSSIPL